LSERNVLMVVKLWYFFSHVHYKEVTRGVLKSFKKLWITYQARKTQSKTFFKIKTKNPSTKIDNFTKFFELFWSCYLLCHLFPASKTLLVLSWLFFWIRAFYPFSVAQLTIYIMDIPFCSSIQFHQLFIPRMIPWEPFPTMIWFMKTLRVGISTQLVWIMGDGETSLVQFLWLIFS